MRIFTWHSDFYERDYSFKNEKYFPNDYLIIGTEDLFYSAYTWSSVYFWYSFNHKNWIYTLTDIKNEKTGLKYFCHSDEFKNSWKEIEFVPESDINSILVKCVFAKNDFEETEKIIHTVFSNHPIHVEEDK